MTDDKRPEWPAKYGSIEAVKFLNHGIVNIAHGWEMTGADTSRNWIDVTSHDGRIMRFECLPDTFIFAPDHATLIRPTYFGREAIATIEAIDKWEKKHAAERVEYERLKRKFGP